MPQPLASDTTPAAEARQISVLRQRSVEERLLLTFELSAFALAASRAAIRRRYPHLSAWEHARLLATLLFGSDHAQTVRCAPNLEGTVAIPAAIEPVARLLDRLAVAYFIGGSIASSAYSLPRTTYDVDIVAAFQPRHVDPFVSSLEADYYVDRGAVLDAIVHHSSFNMTHQPTGINIDIFIPAGRPFDRVQFERVREYMLPGADQAINLASPEDVILNKLAWYELGNRVSDQQWRDVQGILRVQSDALDIAYLRRWGVDLQLSDLLEAALRGERRPQNPPDAPHQDRLF